ncbi:protein argonaute-4-like [Uloborus diversus]|uniref:protein argonaute-4-like n=1 Tax=Uloborus diversus TaxID=327109 RepID=UPI002409DA84|nr:protein argonaute-4-like [Uloborus diversus]
MKEFGITVNPKPLVPIGRVIEPPNLKYMDEEVVRPKDGSWNMKGKEFFISVKIESWVLLSFANEQDCHWGNLNRFSTLLCDISKKIGIDINKPSFIDIIGSKQVTISDILHSMKKKYQANLIVIVLPVKNDKLLYNEIKQAAEIKLGLVTQCVRVANVVEKASASLISNLCQKINSKLGGVNTSLIKGERPAILERSFIVIGADVNHSNPKRGKEDEKKDDKSKHTKNKFKPTSIAAAVGSLDDHPYRYAATVRAQTNPNEDRRIIEIILDLENMVLDLLRAYYRKNQGRKPEKIIFYRDGVSEGEFAKVKEHEVNCIRKACRRLGADYAPKITFIVVQKRHHVRFMPKDYRDGVGKMKNIAPGTTVDNTVVHPQHFDFFLCSHFGLQGTSRPGLYTVVEDDNDLTADELQKLTYYLCYTFARCTKSISIPVPVQYADLAAYRARRHLEFKLKEFNLDNNSLIPNSLFLSIHDSLKVDKQLQDSMYFV